MLFIDRQLVADIKIMLDRVADRIQASVSHSGNDLLFPAVQNGRGSQNKIPLFNFLFLSVSAYFFFGELYAFF